MELLIPDVQDVRHRGRYYSAITPPVIINVSRGSHSSRQGAMFNREQVDPGWGGGPRRGPVVDQHQPGALSFNLRKLPLLDRYGRRGSPGFSKTERSSGPHAWSLKPLARPLVAIRERYFVRHVLPGLLLQPHMPPHGHSHTLGARACHLQVPAAHLSSV